LEQQGPKCPIRVTPSMVAGLIEVLTLLKNRADIATLVNEVGMESGIVLEILEACEALGLVRIDMGDAILTDKGVSFSRKRFSGKIRMLRELVMNTEPFRSVLQYMNAVRKPLSVEEICSQLGLSTGDPEDISRAKTFILDWLVTTGYLQYDGNEERFRLRRALPSADE